MLFDTKFDLIFSLGEACASTSYLRRYNLQTFSYPFDWICAASFEARVEMLVENFSTFLIKENLVLQEKPTVGDVDKETDYYQDIKNGFSFLHDFKTGLPFDDAYLQVKEKYSRRIARLYNEIAKSKRILITWLSFDKHQNKEKVLECYQKLKEKFCENEIYLLVVENGNEFKETYYENQHVLFLEYENVSNSRVISKNDVMGNEVNNAAIFSQIKRRIPIKELPKQVFYKIIKILIGMVPSRKIRPILREAFDKHFYKAKL